MSCDLSSLFALSPRICSSSSTGVGIVIFASGFTSSFMTLRKAEEVCYYWLRLYRHGSMCSKNLSSKYVHLLFHAKPLLALGLFATTNVYASKRTCLCADSKSCIILFAIPWFVLFLNISALLSIHVSMLHRQCACTICPYLLLHGFVSWYKASWLVSSQIYIFPLLRASTIILPRASHYRTYISSGNKMGSDSSSSAPKPMQSFWVWELYYSLSSRASNRGDSLTLLQCPSVPSLFNQFVSTHVHDTAPLRSLLLLGMT